EYGGSREDLAHVAAKNHDNAVENEFAQYQKSISVAEAMESPPVSTPLHLYDACPITDGAAALVLVSASYAAEHDLDAPVAVVGSGQGGDRVALQDRETYARTLAADRAAAEAYDDAGVGPDDVDVAEVHDCFTIAEVLALESLDLYEPGEAIAAAREGETTADGRLPVNLSGGLKAKGHPVGATGASQIAELADLLAGDHVNADRVPDATRGVTHNAGGTVASAVVHVLEVVA
ncbi:3-ketoacyl-CoA thiolase, partial [Halobacteriales archaeon SW_12_71_31]